MRQGVDEEEFLFIHYLTIIDAATPHKGCKMANTDEGDGERLSVYRLRRHERGIHNVL